MSQEKPRPIHKGVYILPNLLTTGSLFSGFLGIMWAIDGRFEACALAILVSAVLDGLDGKVARLTGTASEFGVQFDSLADLVAFGVTPGVMLYLWKLHAFGRLGLMASFLIVICGALRLARFNVASSTSSKKFFIGLPIPAQACIMASFVLFVPFLPESLVPYEPMGLLAMAYVCSFLMVSRVRYASFKEYGFVKAHPFSSMVTVILLFVMVASQPKVLGFLILFGYMLSGPIYTYYLLLRRPSALRNASQKIT
ncbi:CDP-diacylglycerol--serine O-phosphatidyltransferase [Desulfovibrio ferrophilus]|uniref:CDP-diacylglycerol--serine O-phosphatidyltransferase n=1 Tax=Desulfovibrio ferrophilus TaxID=241368 RepID=A0A2Z6AYD7_9BACT|nr:CDP-diacylglycerol--serine O-phosphatidyltransferase [Desulfovibrio ferrophilus]BBD08277.1 CDP-diacylglycerol/serineO-phosphatidyltransferase [Desulfovibrio ferrophilus]